MATRYAENLPDVAAIHKLRLNFGGVRRRRDCQFCHDCNIRIRDFLNPDTAEIVLVRIAQSGWRAPSEAPLSGCYFKESDWLPVVAYLPLLYERMLQFLEPEPLADLLQCLPVRDAQIRNSQTGTGKP